MVANLSHARLWMASFEVSHRRACKANYPRVSHIRFRILGRERSAQGSFPYKSVMVASFLYPLLHYVDAGMTVRSSWQFLAVLGVTVVLGTRFKNHR